MRAYRTPWWALAFLAGASALLASSCDDGIGLLTSDERQSLYRAEASAAGSSTAASRYAQGAILDPSKGVRVLFETVKGSEEPAELSVILKDASGASSVSFLFLTEESPSSSAGALMVPDLVSFSYALDVPTSFPDGYYVLSVEARSTRSESLYRSDIGLFLVRGSLRPPAILAYPANPSPGTRVLLVADLEGYAGRDPYLRWTVDGAVRAEGAASEGRDKLLWPAPLAGSAAAVNLAVYPVSPPPGVAYSFPAPRNASTSLLVAPAAALAPDEFRDPERFLALFRMEDSPDYVGESPGTGSFIGKPELDVHAGGFGLALGARNASGIRTETVLLPIRDGELLPFSLLARFVPDKASDGTLFRAASDASGPALEVSLEEGRPVLIVRARERSAQASASSSLPGGASCLLAVSVIPEGPGLYVAFHIDGKPCGSARLPLGASGWTASGDTRIAGADGCSGLYDEVGVWAFDSEGQPSAYPAFLFASRREYSSTLLMAEEFGGAGASEYVSSGAASVSALEGLTLSPGGAAAFAARLDPPFQADVVLSSGNGILLSLTGNDGTVMRIPLSVSDGRTDSYSGLPLLSVRARALSGGTQAGIRLFAENGGTVDFAASGPWRVGLEGADSGPAVVRFFRVTRSEEFGEE